MATPPAAPGPGLLAEVCPAAGLRHRALTHRGYQGGTGRDVLGTMVDGLARCWRGRPRSA